MYFCLIYVDLKEIAVFSMQNVYLKSSNKFKNFIATFT